MNLLQNSKIVRVTDPAAIVDNASYATTEIDCRGFDYCTIIAYVGATDIAMTALKVQESDTSGSGFADVTGLIYGTSNGLAGTASVIPTATDDNKFFLFEVNLRGRKRYLDVVATAGNGTAGTYCTILAILTMSEDGRDSAADRNVGDSCRI
jgi:hypothetical protein